MTIIDISNNIKNTTREIAEITRNSLKPAMYSCSGSVLSGSAVLASVVVVVGGVLFSAMVVLMNFSVASC